MRLEFTYPYEPQASINRAFNQGSLRKGYKSEVRSWKDGLTLVVKNHLQQQNREIRPPVRLSYMLLAPKRSGAVDAGNFSKIIEDAIFDALPFDDNDLHLIRGPYFGLKTDFSPFFAIVIEEVVSWECCIESEDLKFYYNYI